MLQERAQAVHRLALHGDFDVSRRDELRNTFAALPPSDSLELDLNGVGYLDSTFLNQLAILHRLRGANTSIFIRHANPQIRRLLALVGFDSIFAIE